MVHNDSLDALNVSCFIPMFEFERARFYIMTFIQPDIRIEVPKCLEVSWKCTATFTHCDESNDTRNILASRSNRTGSES
jgi:hypothetical protein